MVQVVEQLVELQTARVAGSLRDQRVVLAEEISRESAEHLRNREIVFVVSVERRGIEDDCQEETRMSKWSIYEKNTWGASCGHVIRPFGARPNRSYSE